MRTIPTQEELWMKAHLKAFSVATRSLLVAR